MSTDADNVKLLSVFHYLLAGLTWFFACFFLIYVAVGIAMVCGAFEDQVSGPPAAFGWIFIVVGSVFVVCGWTIALLSLISAVKLSRRRSWRFCFVVAAIECLVFPFGTVLGVFTLVVLSKPPVKVLFGTAPVPEANPVASPPA